jgi:lipopolysaccharide transport system ATP-binding protein
MSSNIAIQVKNLSKLYPIYDKPIHRLKDFFNFFSTTKNYREFWALKKISFQVKKGETLGIIGRNGSGKSTLLQIITGTVNPTEGTINIDGRIAALLELGSGFNLEFTGRENVYMNASLLGLTKNEIDRKLQAILDFADIGDFVDQPSKSYSSGMLVRLAFAVIAHVDADILIIDEALAVGDAVFTQKCMRFIKQFQKKGTLIFVSHDTNAVAALCDQCIWLNNGQQMGMGATSYINKQYINFCLALTGPSLSKGKKNSIEKIDLNKNFYKDESVKIGKIHFISPRKILSGGENVHIEASVKFNREIKNIIFGYHFKDKFGQVIFGDIFKTKLKISKSNKHEAQVKMAFKLPFFNNGEYSLSFSVAEGDELFHEQLNWLHDIYTLRIRSQEQRYGLLKPEKHKYEITFL